MAAEGDVLEGRYRLLRRIGEGPHGTVFEAEQIGLARHVAVKVVSSEIDRERLGREARAAATLDADGVVRVLDARLDHDPPFVVSELARGASLASLVGEPIAEARAAAITRSILKALARAHENGVFHGDLRPSNIFVDGDSVLLADFGFGEASADGTHTATDLFTARSIVGYRAPERIEGKRADARTDLFAVGACLYEMLEGRRPFAAKAPVDEIAAILSRPAPSARGRHGHVVARALEKQPAKRFASAEEMEAALSAMPRAAIFAAAAAATVGIVVTALLLARAFPARPRSVVADASASASASLPVVAEPAPAPVASEPVAVVAASAKPAPRASRVVIGLLKDGDANFTASDRNRITTELHARLDQCVAQEPGSIKPGEMVVRYPPQTSLAEVVEDHIGSETLSLCFFRTVRAFQLPAKESTFTDYVVHVR